MTVKVGIIGAGTMGSGLAQLAAENDCTVCLYDIFPNALNDAFASVRRRLTRALCENELACDKADQALARISLASDLPELADSDIVIEAIVEDYTAKQKLFVQLEDYIRPDAILATNTSSLSVTKIASELRQPERVCGLHFFNPVGRMDLVEVVAGDETADSTVDRAVSLVKEWGKTAILCQDTPGFVVNRVARPFTVEAVHLLASRIGDVGLIDRVMCELGGFKMGPFRLIDFCGIDVNYMTSLTIFERLGKPERLKPSEFHKKMVKQKKCLGRKTGKGFYDYADPSDIHYCSNMQFPCTSSLILPKELELATKRLGQALGVNAPIRELYILGRILCGLFQEAHFTRDEGVANRDDIDTAMLLGVSYPKGLLAWSDEVGGDTWRGFLGAFEASRKMAFTSDRDVDKLAG